MHSEAIWFVAYFHDSDVVSNSQVLHFKKDYYAQKKITDKYFSIWNYNTNQGLKWCKNDR